MREGRNFCTNFLSKFSFDLDEIWHAAMTCWFVQARTELGLHDLILKGENSTLVILLRVCLRLACVWTLMN